MAQTAVRIGILSPATANRPHFKSLEKILPPGVAVAHEGLGLLGDSYQDLAGKKEIIVACARALVARQKVAGLMLTGGFVTLFNPGVEADSSAAVGLPVVGAISSAIASLTSFGAQSVLLMTPFDRSSDEAIKAYVDRHGFTLQLGPSFEQRIPGASLNFTADQLYDLVVETFAKTPAQAIYFQGATMDPLPIIQRLEDRLGVPVVTSNTAMMWNLLSKLELKYALPGYGKLLFEWPALSP